MVLGFSKGASMVLACYFLLKIVGLDLDNKWHYLLTGYGAWFLVELLGFVALPCFLYAITVREKNLKLGQVGLGAHRARHRAQPLQRLLVRLQLATAGGRPLLSQLDGDCHFHLYRHDRGFDLPFHLHEDADFLRAS